MPQAGTIRFFRLCQSLSNIKLENESNHNWKEIYTDQTVRIARSMHITCKITYRTAQYIIVINIYLQYKYREYVPKKSNSKLYYLIIQILCAYCNEGRRFKIQTFQAKTLESQKLLLQLNDRNNLFTNLENVYVKIRSVCLYMFLWNIVC